MAGYATGREVSGDMSASTDASVAANQPSRLKGVVLQLAGAGAPMLGLILLCVLLSLSTDTFLTFRNMLNVMDQITVLGIMAVGMTLVILIGGIDLAVGSVLAWSVMVMAYRIVCWGWAFVLALLVSSVTSAVFGVFSGSLSTYVGLGSVLG